MLHRTREPNAGLYSPPGGKLEQAEGESPLACALRELEEEVGVAAAPGDLHLTGLISERGFDDGKHYLMFLYELTHPVTLAEQSFGEGRLEWHEPGALSGLSIPRTDREVIWPLFWRYRGSFFSAHIDCTGASLTWRLEQPASDAAASVGDPVRE